MPEAIYILCGLTCLACAVLLLRAYRRSRARLLMWGAACFVALTINNILLFLDLVALPSVDLSLYRHGSTLAGLILMLYGLIWDAE
jgi:hydrogenase/urease accessory protein HupE